MHEKNFFEIPVFRCDIETWRKGNENEKQKLAKAIADREGTEVTERELAFAEDWLRPQWSSFRYTEMVGMIRLFAINGQIRAELWFVRERVSRKLVRKTWKLADMKVFEYWIFPTYTNEQIFSWILKRLKEENKQWLLKGRYIDFEAFENSGKYIDYLQLTNSVK